MMDCARRGRRGRTVWGFSSAAAAAACFIISAGAPKTANLNLRFFAPPPPLYPLTGLPPPNYNNNNHRPKGFHTSDGDDPRQVPSVRQTIEPCTVGFHVRFFRYPVLFFVREVVFDEFQQRLRPTPSLAVYTRFFNIVKYYLVL